MVIKILVVFAGLSIYSCLALAECTLNESLQEERPYKLNISEGECKFVRYGGGRTVSMHVKYPDMKVVYPRVINDSVVSIYLVYVSKEFNQNAVFEGKKPSGVRDGIEIYEGGSSVLRRFVGRNGNPVTVSDGQYTRVADHLFSKEINISYQYTLKHENLKEMDDFVFDFVNKITE